MDFHVEGLGDETPFEDFYRHWRGVEAFFVTTRRSVILPGAGWVVTWPFALQERAMIDYKAWAAVRPGARRYLIDRACARPQYIETVLSLRTLGEGNYFHTIWDIIGGRLRLAEECGVPGDVPIVIAPALAAAPFFKEMVTLTRLRQHTWIVQDHMIESERIFFGQSDRMNRANLDYARLLLDVPDSDPTADRRLFLTRSSTTRTLTNEQEIEDLVSRFGFEIVDTGCMSLIEQMETFADARYVIGIHGAGLTNLIFRKNAPLGLLELFDPAYVRKWRVPQGHYFFLCRALGFEYVALVGESDETSTDRPFAVDPERLRNRMRRLLA